MHFELAATPEERLEQLKGYLRSHAKQFNMDKWFSKGPLGEYDGPDDYLTNKNAIRLLQHDGYHEEALCLFENCKTSACIGGMCSLLCGNTGSSFSYWAEKMGIRLGYDGTARVFYTHNWPVRLADAYDSAISEDRFCDAVESAIEAIDFFQKDPNWERTSKDK